MAAALAVFRDRMDENARIASERAALEARTSEERRAFKKALAPVHERAMVGMDRELMRQVYRDTGFDPGRR